MRAFGQLSVVTAVAYSPGGCAATKGGGRQARGGNTKTRGQCWPSKCVISEGGVVWAPFTQ